MSEKYDYVLDASVGIKLYIKEEFSDRVARLIDRFADDVTFQLAVPDLFFIECTNILWKHVRRYGYPLARATENIETLEALSLASYPTVSLATAALELAIERGISAYDACYVVLADELDTTLLTADERLVRALMGSSHRIEWLGDFTLPESEE